MIRDRLYKSLPPASKLLVILDYAYTLKSEIDPTSLKTTLYRLDHLTYQLIEAAHLKHPGKSVQLAAMSYISKVTQMTISNLPTYEVKMEGRVPCFFPFFTFFFFLEILLQSICNHLVLAQRFDLF